jgi:hypothetical protein
MKQPTLALGSLRQVARFEAGSRGQSGCAMRLSQWSPHLAAAVAGATSRNKARLSSVRSGDWQSRPMRTLLTTRTSGRWSRLWSMAATDQLSPVVSDHETRSAQEPGDRHPAQLAGGTAPEQSVRVCFRMCAVDSSCRVRPCSGSGLGGVGNRPTGDRKESAG